MKIFKNSCQTKCLVKVFLTVALVLSIGIWTGMQEAYARMVDSARVWSFDVPAIGNADLEFWVSIGIRNPGQEMAIITFESYDEAGNIIPSLETFSLKPGDLHFINSANIRGIIPPSSTQFIVVSDQPVIAYSVVGSSDGLPSLIYGDPLTEEQAAQPMAMIMEGVNSCGVINSKGNPYPCCDNGGGKRGNCTWWAWKKAKDELFVTLCNWHDAKDWANNAASQGYKVSSTPAFQTIVCFRTLGSKGHVAWVKQVSGNKILVSEMMCCGGCFNGVRDKWYNKSDYGAKYIYPKSAKSKCK